MAKHHWPVFTVGLPVMFQMPQHQQLDRIDFAFMLSDERQSGGQGCSRMEQLIRHTLIGGFGFFSHIWRGVHMVADVLFFYNSNISIFHWVWLSYWTLTVKPRGQAYEAG